MRIAFNPSTVAALTTPPNNKDITFDLRGRNIFARGVKFYGTDTNTWRDIKVNNVSIGSHTLDLRNGSNTTLTNTNGVVTINSTWRPVVDNLTSNSTTSSLSANLGRVLKALIDGKSNSGHTHDDRYLKLTGGTMASNALITFADSGSWDTDKGPQGARGGLYWSGQSDYAKLYAEETVGDNLDLVIQFGDDNSNGLSIRNKSNVQTSYISAGGVITTGTFKGNLDWSYITNKPATATRWPSWAEVTGKPSSFTPSTHTHGLSNSVFFLSMPSISGNAKWKEVFGYPVNYNLLLSVRINSPAPEWCVGNYGSGILYGGGDTKGFMSSSYNEPLIMWAGGNGSSDDSVPKWYIGIRGTHKSIYNLTTIASEANAAYNLRHSHANKSVLDGITSGLVNNWNTAYTFVHTITGTDTDKVINKWDEIVNFLAGITEDNKLNTLLNSKLSVYQLADKTNVGTIKNNGIYYSTTDTSSGTLTNSPFNTGFALINMTSLDGGDDLRRSRLAFNAFGEIKVSDDRNQANTAETWYNVLTSKNSGISGSTIKLNGTSITVYSSGTADGRYVKKSGDTMTGALNFANGTWNLVGDDSYMGDCNVSGHFGIRAANTTYPGVAFFNKANAHLGSLTAYSGNIKYGAYSLQFLDNGNTSVGASTWTNPFSAYDKNAVKDGQAICVWGQSSLLSNLASDSGDMSLWLKRINAKVATLNMVLDGEYYANGTLRLAHVSEIPTALKNPYALTISLNGTSQGPYDGSAAKSINITPGSIGAATSGHNHDGRYVYNCGGTQMDGASKNKNALGMSTTSGISGDWWHILQAAWNDEYRWNSLIAFPTLNRNGMYYRSGLDDNTKWGAWVKLLDTGNSSISGNTITINGSSLTVSKSDHNHDYLVVNEADEKSFNSAYHNFLVLYAGGSNGITGRPDNVDAFGLIRLRAAGGWSGQMLLANGGSLYIRSSADALMTNTLAWRTILDSSNYSSILDSRYYTESEVNSLLNTKLDRVNLSTGGWNPRGYNLAADYSYNGGDLSISENGGKMYVSIDGLFYQNEGQYRVLDTSDIGSIRGGLTLYLYLSSTDNNWFPLVWGGSDHKNTNNSTGSLYKSHDKLSWLTSSLTLYATKLRTTNLDTLTAIFHPDNDSTLKIYSGKTLDAVSDGHIGLQTSINNTDGQTHVYPTLYGSRCVLALLPRGGSVYIGNMPNGGNGRKLNVNGDIGLFNTGSIRDLAIGGGIYWNPHVESATDGSDAASITLVRAGVAGGTTLVLSLMNDTNDTILFKTNDAARLYHNSNLILTSKDTKVSSGKGYINNTEITLVNNANKWTTARAFTIGNTSKSVDGSSNVSWSLSEIGAASSGHNHDNKYLRWLGNANQSNMNAIGRISHSSGMTALSDPGNTTDNPMEGGTKSNSWHLYWQTNYTDDPSGSNAWVALIVNRAGTDRWWVRSRNGGKITNGTGWASNWRFLVTAPTSGLGNSNLPIYINSAGEVVAANTYPTSLRSPHSLTLKANGTTLAIYDGSSAKEANFTYANVGAASASHTHSIYAVNENYGGFKKAERLPTSGFYQSYISDKEESSGNAPWTSWMHLINCLHSNTGNNYALLIAASFFDNNIFKIRVTNNSVNNAWRDIIHSGNIGSQSVNYANSAGNSDKVDGYHASSLWRSDGGTWNPGANISLNASGNNQEWSFDIRRNGYTGCYWHVLDSARGSMLKVNADNGKVYAPYNFVGNLEGNANSATTASSANKLTTARNIALGTDLRGSANFDGSSNIIINANINACSVSVSSTDGLHFKRIAHFETGSSWNDNALLLYISLGYINGSNGICRVEFRTDNISTSNSNPSASALVRWLVRNGYGLDSLYAGYYVTTGKAYIDIYLKTTGGYQGTVIRVLLDSRGSINSNVLLINSHYHSDSDHKEAYNSIEAAATALYNRAYTRIVSGSDVGAVSYSNSTGSVHWNNVTNKPSTFNPAAHTHTVFKNNLMIKGTNGISDSASIHLGIGDSDTGFKWISDGKCLIYANNVSIGEWTSGGMNWLKNPTVNGNKVWNAGNDGSGSGLDADMLDGYHESSFLRYRGATSTDLEATLWSLIGIKLYNNALPDDLTNVYNYGSVISLPGLSSRFEIYAPHGASAGNGLYYRSGLGNDKKSWCKFIDSSNIGSLTVTNAYHLRINSANSWSTWNWSGQSGQPSWLWGSNDGTNMYVWNPSNFNVNTALYLRSLGNRNCLTGRTLAYGDVYTYNTHNDNTGSATTYSSVIGFGRGTGGTVEIAGGWCNTNLYWRSLRDCCEDWFSWRTILDESNYASVLNNTYLPLAGGTMKGNARIGHGSGSLYIGNSGNDGWLYVQDMASQAGEANWKIYANGFATFKNLTVNGPTVVNGSTTLNSVTTLNGLVTNNRGILPASYDVNKNNTACYVWGDAMSTGVTAITDALDPKYVSVHYSNDNGASWTNFNSGDVFNLYANNGRRADAFYLGHYGSDDESLTQVQKNQLMVTFEIPNTMYSALCWASVDIGNGVQTVCTVEIIAKDGTIKNTFTKNLYGWNTVNYINFWGNNSSVVNIGLDTARFVRFKFKHDTSNTATRNALIIKIRLFSFTKYNLYEGNFSSHMAYSGHLYTYDKGLNATFPNGIKVTYGPILSRTNKNYYGADGNGAVINTYSGGYYLQIGKDNNELILDTNSNKGNQNPALYIKDFVSANRLFKFNSGLAVPPVDFLSTYGILDTITILNKKYVPYYVGTLGLATGISFILADNSTDLNLVIVIRKGLDGEVCFIKDAGNGVFRYYLQNTSLMLAGGLTVQNSGTFSTGFDDGKARFIIYSEKNNTWYEFYCG